jgi:hypothetical protein
MQCDGQTRIGMAGCNRIHTSKPGANINLVEFSRIVESASGHRVVVDVERGPDGPEIGGSRPARADHGRAPPALQSQYRVDRN